LSNPPRSTPSDAALGLPARIVRLTRTAQGIELCFPPLRSVAASAGLGAFGVICTALPTAAGAALVSAFGFDAHGLLVIALLAGFVLPLFAFGLTFVALAVYQLANSLYVRVERAGIATARRAFGFTFGRRVIGGADIAAIVPQIPSRFQSPLATEPSYRLIALNRAPGKAGMVVAESLSGEALMERVRMLIEDAAGLSRSEEKS
jgi:hypothetical protein